MTPLLAAVVFATVSGRIVKVETKDKRGLLTIADGAGREDQYAADALTKATCDGKKAAWDKDAVPGACDRVVKGRYDKRSKRLVSLELASALKADAAAAQTRPTVSGEVAVTDVLAGKITVRLGGGGNVDFKVGEATKVLRAGKDGAAETVQFESLKVGERVDVRSSDWKTADEIRVAPAN